MRHCIICSSDFFVTPPFSSCDCGHQVTRDRALTMPTAYLVSLRKEWLDRYAAMHAAQMAGTGRYGVASGKRIQES